MPDGILLVEADAALMMNWEEGLFPQLATVFQFPDYFGDNCHALNECITDLDWLPAEGYLFVIKNSASLLLEESDDDLGVLLGNSCQGRRMVGSGSPAFSYDFADV